MNEKLQLDGVTGLSRDAVDARCVGPRARFASLPRAVTSRTRAPCDRNTTPSCPATRRPPHRPRNRRGWGCAQRQPGRRPPPRAATATASPPQVRRSSPRRAPCSTTPAPPRSNAPCCPPGNRTARLLRGSVRALRSRSRRWRNTTSSCSPTTSGPRAPPRRCNYTTETLEPCSPLARESCWPQRTPCPDDGSTTTFPRRSMRGAWRRRNQDSQAGRPRLTCEGKRGPPCNTTASSNPTTRTPNAPRPRGSRRLPCRSTAALLRNPRPRSRSTTSAWSPTKKHGVLRPPTCSRTARASRRRRQECRGKRRG
mmetsp:Transcript_104379/g.290714  ORF Transcript_104379/g.290714 Transcript_104379/m.290714 type:complete len:311 (-) Transcript_104379:296-1228(-)